MDPAPIVTAEADYSRRLGATLVPREEAAAFAALSLEFVTADPSLTLLVRYECRDSADRYYGYVYASERDEWEVIRRAGGETTRWTAPSAEWIGERVIALLARPARWVTSTVRRSVASVYPTEAVLSTVLAPEEVE